MIEDILEESAGPDPSLAIIAVAHGKVHELYVWMNEHVGEHISALGGDESWDEAISSPPDGIWVCELRIVDDGPSDWGYGDIRDVRLEASELRAPTTEEWSRLIAEECVWDGEKERK